MTELNFEYALAFSFLTELRVTLSFWLWDDRKAKTLGLQSVPSRDSIGSISQIIGYVPQIIIVVLNTSNRNGHVKLFVSKHDCLEGYAFESICFFVVPCLGASNAVWHLPYLKIKSNSQSDSHINLKIIGFN